ncbi:radical SAM family heme chaperone HemW [Apibacter sp. HY039]|uniref:radical SAM family heme chaperone HemW n=1 Tax=Apibacter sp. HY039 TaxID=2501476 RepID=UPI003519DC1D
MSLNIFEHHISMSGLYIHIPFCHKKCNYCNFHFSTQLDFKPQLVKAIEKELFLRKDEFKNIKIETLYFGGGTPSLLSKNELYSIFNTLHSHYSISELQEITLESNPEDLTSDFLLFLKNETPINRLSIGIQSFNDYDLKLMNRSHSSLEAEKSIMRAQNIGLNNITIDLIYGGQSTSNQIWIDNLQKAIQLNIPHISSYALTVEPKTAFESLIKKGKLPDIDEDRQLKQFELLRKILYNNDFIQYEFSNFGKKGYFSKHNTSYWNSKAYIGIGPSAHSFNGTNIRSWNISNNIHYIKSLNNNILPLEQEFLDEKDVYNEKIMLGLRTQWGININSVLDNFSKKIVAHFLKETEFLKQERLIITNSNSMMINPEYLFQTDGIISRLFFID